MGRFFGIHDDSLRGWNRVGTLPANNRAQEYNAIGQDGIGQESIPVLYTPPTTPPERTSPPQRRRGRMGRMTDRVAATIRRKKRGPTADEVQKSLPMFWPVMTIIIVIIEISLLVAMIITGGLAPIKLRPETVTAPLLGFDNISDSGYKQIVPNFFVGASKETLIHTGAMYTPVSKIQPVVEPLIKDPLRKGQLLH